MGGVKVSRPGVCARFAPGSGRGVMFRGTLGEVDNLWEAGYVVAGFHPTPGSSRRCHTPGHDKWARVPPLGGA